ncbi:ligase-associated DNA damage response endonuclease PdeM [Halovulum dunhuangense]|uniref:Ligase-associated DNA damage response endonuclease PdeM n=1 Tax=Halovulum dunhuangense TaxID=1505036 RepID=A0A849L4Z3_9RHOB|nr:ligase-associated DNA damage response endonuclease PdeM [Halovulum dunhuangense]NNU81254.1 ligase-associated DNA damage response endonuclease PdeM [Halovulum dunhuangense]
MLHTEFMLSGIALTARPTGALWWQEAAILCVADLHLGKAERLARRGGTLLPPYETAETLARLATEIEALSPRTVICLGDSFDDPESARQLDEEARRSLAGLMAGRRWIWVAGNHDPNLPDIGGSHMEEVLRGPLTFRHIARPRDGMGEVSGHYHPKISVQTRAGQVTRPCFVQDGQRAILPAFGAYTGGLSCTDPALQGLFGPEAVCILTGRATATVPLKSRATA